MQEGSGEVSITYTMKFLCNLVRGVNQDLQKCEREKFQFRKSSRKML